MDRELLEVLACPKCKKSIEWKDEKLICGNCKKYYPIRDGIPVMLIEEAKDYKEQS
ncbi:MAG: Trm112 family protein [Candidatus Ratteibacteria bacterium]|nr:Trm112 family protein [Candidatus Ratteibacteria bacterium]